jgi:hypothetical protein
MAQISTKENAQSFALFAIRMRSPYSSLKIFRGRTITRDGTNQSLENHQATVPQATHHQAIKRKRRAQKTLFRRRGHLPKARLLLYRHLKGQLMLNRRQKK